MSARPGKSSAIQFCVVLDLTMRNELLTVERSNMSHRSAATRFMPHRYCIDAHVLSALGQCSRDRGLDFSNLCRRCGIDVNVALDRDAVIPLLSFAKLLELCATEGADPAFGLHFGLNNPRGSAGLYHYIVVSSATVREALQVRARLAGLAVSGGYPVEFTEDDEAGYYVWHFPPGILRWRQYIDYAVSLAIARIRFMTTENWSPVGDEFQYSAPRLTRPYRAVFGETAVFGRPVTRLVIDKAVLDRPSRHNDADLAAILTPIGERKLGIKASRSAIEARAARAIETSLPGGQATLSRVADSLRMSQGEVRRRLAKEGKSFSGLRDEVRRETAKRLLEAGTLSLTEISFRVGFSELSAFSRAAKSWFGEKPRALRGRQRRAGGKS